jgi:hypothetical protein
MSWDKSWVKEALEALTRGQSVQVRPQGCSMRGRIESGQLVALDPADGSEIAEDDVVFIRWKGNYLLHLVKQVDDDRLLIGNNVGKINGWVDRSDVIGKVVNVSG